MVKSGSVLRKKESGRNSNEISENSFFKTYSVLNYHIHIAKYLLEISKSSNYLPTTY